MKIKSMYKDYYDFALSGITNPDETIVYPRILDIKDYKINLDIGNQKHIIYSKVYILIGEKFFKCIQEVEVDDITDFGKKVLSIKYIYDIEEINKKEINEGIYKNIEKFLKEDISIEIKKDILSLREKAPIVILKAITNVAETTPNRWTDWRGRKKEKDDKFKEENRKVVFLEEYMFSTKYVLNDSLKNISFNKKMNAYEVYQEIEQYLLKENSIEKEVIFTDKEKLQQHGFDKKSFKN